MLPKSFTILLDLFYILGFFPEYLTIAKYRNLSKAVFVLNNLSAILFLYHLIHIKNVQMFSRILPMINAVMKFGLLIICYWLAQIESIAQRSTQRKFWRHFRQIRCECILSDHRYIFKYIYIVFTIVGTILLLTPDDYYNSLFTLMSHLAFINSMIMYISRCFYYLFYIEIIKSILKMIGDGVRESVKVSESEHRWTKQVSSGQFCFKSIRENYLLVYELRDYLNSTFGWSQSAIILFLFYNLISDILWAYWYGSLHTIFYQMSKLAISH